MQCAGRSPNSRIRFILRSVCMRWACFSTLLIMIAVPQAFAEKPSKRTALDDRIDRAIAYLHQTQDKDGSWKAGGHGKNAAITGLAVMAFLSAGHVPGEGRYADTIEKGINAVLEMQQTNGLIGSNS